MYSSSRYITLDYSTVGGVVFPLAGPFVPVGVLFEACTLFACQKMVNLVDPKMLTAVGFDGHAFSKWCVWLA